MFHAVDEEEFTKQRRTMVPWTWTNVNLIMLSARMKVQANRNEGFFFAACQL